MVVPVLFVNADHILRRLAACPCERKFHGPLRQRLGTRRQRCTDVGAGDAACIKAVGALATITDATLDDASSDVADEPDSASSP